MSCQNGLITAGSEMEGDDLAALDADLMPGLELIQDIGKVQYINMEGGFWGIVGSKANYEPLNLPKEFCVNGLYAIFTAQLVPDARPVQTAFGRGKRRVLWVFP
ncbi:MAG: hypothetical protein JW969_11345 [Spirochaetales bacterium]|nr:hypothetical protein [Spirochaetales bacterium]